MTRHFKLEILTFFFSQADRRRDRVTGLDTVQFDIVAVEEIKIDNAPANIVRVELYCDLQVCFVYRLF